jgi:hypothetical protein
MIHDVLSYVMMRVMSIVMGHVMMSCPTPLAKCRVGGPTQDSADRVMRLVIFETPFASALNPLFNETS